MAKINALNKEMEFSAMFVHQLEINLAKTKLSYSPPKQTKTKTKVWTNKKLQKFYPVSENKREILKLTDIKVMSIT